MLTRTRFNFFQPPKNNLLLSTEKISLLTDLSQQLAGELNRTERHIDEFSEETNNSVNTLKPSL